MRVASYSLECLDLRTTHASVFENELQRFVAEFAVEPGEGREVGIRALVIVGPQESDQLALELARCGIRLIIDSAHEPVSALVGNLDAQLKLIGSGRMADLSMAAQQASASTTNRNITSPRARSESPLAQRPPWFDQAAFDERMRSLQQPWRDEDAWKSET